MFILEVNIGQSLYYITVIVKENEADELSIKSKTWRQMINQCLFTFASFSQGIGELFKIFPSVEL